MDNVDVKISSITAIADELPGVIIILDAHLNVVYISKRGERHLGASLDEIRAMGQDYHTRFFNHDDIEAYIPKIKDTLHNGNENTLVSFFQQVRSGLNNGWEWHFSAMRMLSRNPVFYICMAYPVDSLNHVNSKIDRLMQENLFLRQNSRLFATLGKREKEILGLLAIGKSANEIAEQLFIAETTVETHRKNIKRKLNINTVYELTRFAQAFDLI